MNLTPLLFLTNSMSVAQALEFVHTHAQNEFVGELSEIGLDIDDAEQLLNASIPNHIQKSHALAIRFERSNDWFVFLKKSTLGADLEPYLIQEKQASLLGLSRFNPHVQWIELNSELKKELNESTRVKLAGQPISMDILLTPACTLSKECGALAISLPFSRKASYESLKTLIESQAASQYLGLQTLSKWIKLNQNRPASEQTALASIFTTVSVESPGKGQIDLIQPHPVLVCSGTEPCCEDGLVRPEFVNPACDMPDALRSQGLEADIVEILMLDAAQMKKAVEMHFNDLLQLLETVPD